MKHYKINETSDKLNNENTKTPKMNNSKWEIREQVNQVKLK